MTTKRQRFVEACLALDMADSFTPRLLYNLIPKRIGQIIGQLYIPFFGVKQNVVLNPRDFVGGF
ncbi:hypothetical protein LAC1533_0262 [Ligilactobacillus acidipiscis]|uniref:Uncharacterized protein n=1 Tax=Ligilactobacillus acidipiscis TaxID=89059 RepID=A0A1K1KLG0_9LACO|nr:hypothetical protein LAC1533_0262 [Ligilactobacillus acidipiscis]